MRTRNDVSLTEHLSALEQSLLDPKARADSDRVAELLSDDFFEFGSSGRVWDKRAVIAGLATGNANAATTLRATNIDIRTLSMEVALVTYTVAGVAEERPVQTLRSSVWRREGDNWRMVFHQGTPVPTEVTA